MMSVSPGDVVLVRITEGSWLSRVSSKLIRLGGALHDQPSAWNHVIIASHVDATGVFWGAEGRPGGVGWTDMAPWLADHYTISNADQPKTSEQRTAIVAGAAGMVDRKLPYDWPAIAVDLAEVIRPLWMPSGKWGKGSPGHVVCSSAADWLYERVGLASPQPDRFCTPADWADFILSHGWGWG